jgi:hypothetical protein
MANAKNILRGGLLVLAGVMASQVAKAGQVQPPAPPAPPAAADGVAGWNELIDSLRDLPAHMLAKLPEEQRRDPQIQQEVGRLALAAFAASAIDTLGSDGDHPAFVAQINAVLNVGQPNADTSYRVAKITPGGTYRIRGTRGTLRMVRIAQGAPPKPPVAGQPNLGPQRIDHDVNALRVDAHDRFDVILSPTRPEGYKGEWWPLQPTTDKLLLRMVGVDWGKEKEPTFAIERLDRPVERPRPSAADLEKRLRALPRTTGFIASLFVDHVAKLRAEGYVNKLKIFDVSQLGGLAGQFYYEGAYDLTDDEALIVEATVPKKCLYRSIILTNDLYETTDWYNNHSSLNDTQAHPDKDGVLRIIVSARDPGVANWVDTAGYPTGVIQGRWAECDTQPVPSVRKVAFADIRKQLPAETVAVTPEQRDRILRDRRAALQRRPLW